MPMSETNPLFALEADGTWKCKHMSKEDFTVRYSAGSQMVSK
jgi:hypothetical protein